MPSVPRLYNELVEELKSPDPSIKNVGGIISKDAAMTAKILQMVNSAFFGLANRITNPVTAVNLLGINTILSLVLSVKVFEKFESIDSPGFSIDQIFDHGLRTASYAKAIAKSVGLDETVVDDSFVAGLLHDCGRLVLIGNVPEMYSEIKRLTDTHNTAIEYAEKKVFRATHAELGAYLLGIWGLPDSIIEAVAYHHSPNRSTSKTISALTTVYAANVIDNAIVSNKTDDILEYFDLEYMEKVNAGEKVQSWVEICSNIGSEVQS